MRLMELLGELSAAAEDFVQLSLLHLASRL